MSWIYDCRKDEFSNTSFNVSRQGYRSHVPFGSLVTGLGDAIHPSGLQAVCLPDAEAAFYAPTPRRGH